MQKTQQRVEANLASNLCHSLKGESVSSISGDWELGVDFVSRSDCSGWLMGGEGS